MPYVGSDGSLQQSRPFGFGMIYDLFWSTVTFVNLFFRSLLHLDDNQNSSSRPTTYDGRPLNMRAGRLRGVRGSMAGPPMSCGPSGG